MTTAEFLSRLAAISLAASAAVLLVLALRPVLRRFLGPRLAYGLWLMVPITMLGALAPVPPAMSQAIGRLVHPAAATGIEWIVYPAALFPPRSAPAIATPVAPAMGELAPSLLLYAWLIGAAAFLCYLFFGQHRAVERLGLLGRDAAGFVRAASRDAGPALIGLVRPRIILPSDFETRFQPREQELILAHERTHLRHGDLWINGLCALIQILNWFNPLVHLAAFLLRVDQELACDAAVVGKFPGERRTYAGALLKSQRACIPLPLGCHWPGRSPTLLQERLTMLAIQQPTPIRLLAGGGLVGALCLAAGAAAWAAAGPAGSAPRPAAALAPVMTYAPANTPASRPAVAQPETVSTTVGLACLSNSCGQTAASGAADAAAVAAAIQAGDARAVIAAGGSAQNVLDAWAAADRLAGRSPLASGGLPRIEQAKAGSAQFVMFENSMLAVRAETQDGQVMVMMRTGLEGVTPPAGTEAFTTPGGEGMPRAVRLAGDPAGIAERQIRLTYAEPLEAATGPAPVGDPAVTIRNAPPRPLIFEADQMEWSN